MLPDYSREVLLDTPAISRGSCREAEVRRLLDEHADGPHDHGRGIWRLLVLELWYLDISGVRRADNDFERLSVVFEGASCEADHNGRRHPLTKDPGQIGR